MAQATGENAEGLMQRYPTAVARNFDGDGQVTEMDAVIAYLQVLGTLVDFSTFKADMSRYWPWNTTPSCANWRIAGASS